MLPQIKKKFVSAALGLAISIPTVAVFTGVAPINVAGISNTQPANASQTYWTWWDNYTYLNKQETYNLAA